MCLWNPTLPLNLALPHQERPISSPREERIHLILIDNPPAYLSLRPRSVLLDHTLQSIPPPRHAQRKAEIKRQLKRERREQDKRKALASIEANALSGSHLGAGARPKKATGAGWLATAPSDSFATASGGVGTASRRSTGNGGGDEDGDEEDEGADGSENGGEASDCSTPMTLEEREALVDPFASRYFKRSVQNAIVQNLVVAVVCDCKAPSLWRGVT